MMLRSAIMLAAVAAATATAPGIRASVSSAGLQYIVVSIAAGPGGGRKLGGSEAAICQPANLPFNRAVPLPRPRRALPSP